MSGPARLRSLGLNVSVMGGAFGGLLQILERIGLSLQTALRHFLWLLIGMRAYDWSLATLDEQQTGFQDQRLAREILGGLVVLLFEVPLLAAFGLLGFELLSGIFILGLAQGAVLLVAGIIRYGLEEKARRRKT